MTPTEIVAYLGGLALLVGALTAGFTQLFGASKVSFNQLKLAFDKLKEQFNEQKSINAQLRAENEAQKEQRRVENIAAQQTIDILQAEKLALTNRVSALEEQVEKLKNALAEALRTIGRLKGKKEGKNAQV